MINLTIHCETCGEQVEFKEGALCGQGTYTHRGKNPVHVKHVSRDLELLNIPYTVSFYNMVLGIEESITRGP